MQLIAGFGGGRDRPGGASGRRRGSGGARSGGARFGRVMMAAVLVAGAASVLAAPAAGAAPASPAVSSAVAATSPLAVTANGVEKGLDGRLELFHATGTGVSHRTQVLAGSNSWTPWAALPGA